MNVKLKTLTKNNKMILENKFSIFFNFKSYINRIYYFLYL